MAKTFTTMVELENYVGHLCTEAIRHAMQRCVKQLRTYIDEDYYKQYEPLFYKPRTMEFFKSATATLLSPTSAEIGIDDDYFNYEYPARYMMFENGGGTDRNVSGHWTGEDQVNMAAHGYHGSYDIQTEGRFWDDFSEWMNENAIRILREELEIQGLKLSK